MASASPDPVAQLIEAIDEPVLVLDMMHVAQANAAARALLGDYIVGRYVRLVVRHTAAAPVLSGETDGPVALSGIDAQDRAWELSGTTIAAGRRLLRFVDRSAIRAAERIRVDFVANASHELRTPLAALIGFIETLGEANRPDDADTRTRFLAIMAREAARMQSLIEDLMSLSRIEADRHARPRDVIDLAEIITAACADLPTGDAERVRCTIMPVAIEGDRGQLMQLFDNIVGNALKYSRPGTPVLVSLDAGLDEARLAVIDRGDGIAPEHLSRLTERFYRVDAGRSRTVGGTGLGLAIVKHIVERHRGRLDIDSVVGEGTSVTITLPLAGIEPPAPPSPPPLPLMS